jgi:helix-turn-helix protein
MGSKERRLTARRGKYARPVVAGNEIRDASWTQARIVVTTERLILFGAEGEKLSIRYADVTDFEGRCDVNQACRSESSYTGLRLDTDVTLVSAAQQSELDHAILRGALDEGTMHVKHPTTVGGVVQDETFLAARIRVRPDELQIVLRDGRKLRIAHDQIAAVRHSDRTVDDEVRRIRHVRHTADGRAVQTQLLPQPEQCLFVDHLLEDALDDTVFPSDDLSTTAIHTIIALQTGIEPWAVPAFLDRNPAEIEALYDDLVERDIAEVARTRREVRLTSEGRQFVGKTSEPE